MKNAKISIFLKRSEMLWEAFLGCFEPMGRSFTVPKAPFVVFLVCARLGRLPIGSRLASPVQHLGKAALGGDPKKGEKCENFDFSETFRNALGSILGVF